MAKIAPSKSEITLMPNFIGLSLENIYIPNNAAEFAAAYTEIMTAKVVGFDTESKPTFTVGQKSDGPHLIQFALTNKAYLFQLHHLDSHEYLRKLLQAEQLIKIGFGLKSDSRQIHAKLNTQLNGALDLNEWFRTQGYHPDIGVKTAVALVFQQRFSKSKKNTTSNWARNQLSESQLCYAANDAYAAFKVFEALSSTGQLTI